MRVVISFLFVALVLAGCAAPWVEAREDRECQTYGYTPDTLEYGACRERLAEGRRNRGLAIMGVGAGLMAQPQPQTRTTSCIPNGLGGYNCSSF